jgi:hypothetical protein
MSGASAPAVGNGTLPNFIGVFVGRLALPPPPLIAFTA